MADLSDLAVTLRARAFAARNIAVRRRDNVDGRLFGESEGFSKAADLLDEYLTSPAHQDAERHRMIGAAVEKLIERGDDVELLLEKFELGSSVSTTTYRVNRAQWAHDLLTALTQAAGEGDT